MERKKDVVIKEYNSLVSLNCCLSIDELNVIACGDVNGRVLLFDVRQHKPIVKLINTNVKSEIK